MTDRELLELAAKAAGLRVKTWDGHVGVMCAIDDDRHGTMWMPLSDDGDALRLAVKLGLDLLRTDQDVEAIAGLPPYVKADQPHAVAPFGIVALGDDPYAATRRAIVRAAAEIGRNMS